MESTEILFQERQRFKQLWIWLLLISIFMVPLVMDLQGYIALVKSGEYGAAYTTQIVAMVVVVFMVSCRVDTVVYKDRICYRFYPLQISYREIKAEEIAKAFIRKYNAIMEYGGWGMRLGLFGRGPAINASGDMGLQLELKNGDRLLIGTQKWKALGEVIEKIGVVAK